MSFSLLKGIARDYRVGPTTNVITFHELDVLFPLPHDPSPLDLTQTALGQPPIFQNAISRHRRDVFRQLEDVLYLHGVDGRTCILKALCEARQTVPQEVENLMLDLLLVLFSCNLCGALLKPPSTSVPGKLSESLVSAEPKHPSSRLSFSSLAVLEGAIVTPNFMQIPKKAIIIHKHLGQVEVALYLIMVRGSESAVWFRHLCLPPSTLTLLP
ncbi:hypothetical protein J6590_089426 [Homalodisca vitripennis]|nr:hypothetical protein J6590_089426 [Homalodisca vitripennis]